MTEHFVVTLILFTGFFLALTSFLEIISRKTTLPYTVLLLIAGFLTQLSANLLHLDLHFTLSPSLIYYVLLPLLLFESTLHIHIHQFRLQFKTITFIATFGLMISIFIIGFGLALLLKLPLTIALLFGALISATDPIAVIALFKSLGAPKRLGLIADGESMFNDATAVIAFRILSEFVLINAAFETHILFAGLGNFLYVFFGSIIFGFVVGYITSKLIARISNDRLGETTLSIALALFSFTGAEHFFHLSGVISTVIAGLTIGNLGRTKFSSNVIIFIEELWDYIAFISVSLVFFFASFNLDIKIFNNIRELLIVILVVLIARAFSVYGTAFFSNRLKFFKDEPNIPLKWQHILNWGGLRGVIPLVLVYTLPDTFIYKNLLLSFTLATLLFTIIINGLSIQWLLVKLKLHIPKKEEEIINDENRLYTIINEMRKLRHLPKREFEANILRSVRQSLQEQEESIKKHLNKLAKPTEFNRSLRLQAVNIELTTLKSLFSAGRITENAYFEFESELDLQIDAIEYPEAYKGRAISRGGFIHPTASYRKRLFILRRNLLRFPTFAKILGINEDKLIKERYTLLRARNLASFAVIDYLNFLKRIMTKNHQKDAIKKMLILHKKYLERNTLEAYRIEKKHPKLVKDYQERIIHSLIIAPAISVPH